MSETVSAAVVPEATGGPPVLAGLHEAALRQVAKVIVGQEELVRAALVGLFAGGHMLVEGPPGTAKTLLARVLARVFGGRFSRIQFTPDLMPADIIGTSVFDLRTQAFEFRPGPIFGEFVLADEINRAPAKTQAALLEAMQERQVTVDGATRPLPETFTVFATQNPIEQEGTYPLPEAQLDRFLMKLVVPFPTAEAEVGILRAHQQGTRSTDLDAFGVEPVASRADLLAAQAEIRGRSVREELLRYLADVIRATRTHLRVEVGASPRAGLMLLTAAKARAALAGRGHVLPDDIKAVAKPVLRHRLVLKPGAAIDGFTADGVVDAILAQVEVPR